MYKILINNQLVDNPTNFDVSLRKIILDITNPISLNETGSYTITFPETSKNNKVFNWINNSTIINKFTTTQWDCKVLLNDNEIINGLFYLDSIKNGYSGNIVNTSIINFFDLLSDSSGNDLTFKDISLQYPTHWKDWIEDDLFTGWNTEFLFISNWAKYVLYPRLNQNIKNKGLVFPYIHRYNKNLGGLNPGFNIPNNFIINSFITFDEVLPSVYILDLLTCISKFTNYNLVISDEVKLELSRKVLTYSGKTDWNWGLGENNPMAFAKTIVPFDPKIVNSNTWVSDQVILPENNYGRFLFLLFPGSLYYYCNWSGTVKVKVRTKQYMPIDDEIVGTNGKMIMVSYDANLADINTFFEDSPSKIKEWDNSDDIKIIYYKVEKGNYLVCHTNPFAYYDFFEISYVTEQVDEIGNSTYIEWGNSIPVLWNYENSIKTFLKDLMLIHGLRLNVSNNTLYINKISDSFQILKLEDNVINLEMTSKEYLPNDYSKMIIKLNEDEADINYNKLNISNNNNNIKNTIDICNTGYTTVYVLKSVGVYKIIPFSVPVIASKEIIDQSRQEIDWVTWYSYEPYDDVISYLKDDLVKTKAFLYNKVYNNIEVITYRYFKCILNTTPGINPADSGNEAYWEEQEAPITYNSDFSFDFKLRILELEDVDSSYTEYNDIDNPDIFTIDDPTKEFFYLAQNDFKVDSSIYPFGQLVKRILSVPVKFSKAIKPIEYDNITDKLWKKQKQLLNKSSNILKTKTYIDSITYNKIKDIIPLVVIDNSLHLLIEITEWNLSTNEANIKLLKWN